ncbi:MULTISPECIES: hypothetical protein [Virgibacillus]|uniref:Uncharacterized protein n=1 Tax=Virgibacillus massiliensis TaxID=1462526 RepID=A0A024Q6V0_9BACI|nr:MULTISPECIES: hypothetical protein [Virgibacillus]EQB38282.1 hypothetical protein M948_06800 [Virgibacillus sp. CM-4]CDQ38214.1 hypothetical protein BN990_00481 [Virgibacillus massiliensis]
MDKKHTPLLLGLVAIVSAFIPVFPKVLTLIGCLAGIIGTYLSTKLPHQMTTVRYQKLSKLICYIGTAIAAIMFLYTWVMK